jgi:XRE family transcriptional regulator, aerobic/anaerobic benzoate catabolism transcriptional regulator
MSSNILHSSGPALADTLEAETAPGHKHPFLVALGERVRSLRERRGMTRRALSAAADVSERHLANLEYGVGNASILVLLQVAAALQCSLAQLLGAGSAHDGHGAHARSRRVALVGLRGAGKSTLGQRLADDLGVAFVELSRQIEKSAGCSISEILALYGQSAYRRYERRALEESIQRYPQAVIATPGGIVSDAATFSVLLAQCTSVWLSAAPQDHMKRVVAQGDMRPMRASAEAMKDLRSILASRAPFYSKAEFHIDTSAQPLEDTFVHLRQVVRQALAWAA